MGFPWISVFFLLCYRHTLVYDETNGQKDSTQIKCAVNVKEMDGYILMKNCTGMRVREWKEGRTFISMHVWLNCMHVYARALCEKKGKNTVETIADSMENQCVCASIVFVWVARSHNSPNRFFHVRKSITSLSFLFLPSVLLTFHVPNFPKHFIL